MIVAEKPIISFFSPALVHEFDLGKYSSLRWRRKYYEPGEFEIHTSVALFTQIYRGQLVLRADRKEAGVVKAVNITESGLTISGRFLSVFLADAAIKTRYDLNTTIETAMRKLVTEQYGRFAHALTMKLAAAKGYTETVQAQVSLKNLLTVTEALAKAGNVGFIVYPSVTEKCLYFETYKGKDHTVLQAENARVIFSSRYNNISGPEYKEDDASYKNYAIVCGQGEGADRVIVEVDRTNGEDRRELLVDAKDLSQGDQTADEYKAALAARGQDKLAESALVQTFETGIKSTSQFVYMTHWDLGDLVTAEKTEWGLQTDQRITEVEEVYENNGFSATPTLGTPAPETFNLEGDIA